MRGRLIAQTWTHDPTAYAPPRYRRACRYDAFVPSPIGDFDEPMDARTAGAISDAEQALARVNAGDEGSLRPLARLLLRTESIASSKVEGLQVDARALAIAEARSEAGARLGPTATEILGNIDAMELAIDEAATAASITPDHIVAIHHRLMTAAPNSVVAGRIRTEQNWIGGNDYNPCGAAFVPPPPDEVAHLIADLCVAINDDHLPPVLQAAIVHAQFETIHPFLDGNGRTGRALIHVVLRRRGTTPRFVPPISVAFARHRDRYIAGLTAFREDRLRDWIDTFASAAVSAATLTESYRSETDRLTNRWHDQIRERYRSDSAVYAILAVLPAHPVITTPIATAVTGRAKSAVGKALGDLAEAGILAPIGEGRRNRAWEAREVLDLIVQFDS